MIARALLVLVLACSCKDQQERAIERAREVGMNPSKENCVKAAGGEGGDSLAICTDGRRLIICVEDDDCLTVNLDPEMPTSAPANR